MNLAIRGIDGQIGARRHLPRRQVPGPQGRLCAGQPALQRQRLARRPAQGGHALAVWRAADGQRQLCLGAALSHHLAPTGIAGFVLANGSMSSNQSGEGEIRKHIVEADLVDCMVALPGQLFYSTQIPVCLWFLARDKRNGRFRERRGETLFIDARKLGSMVDRTHRELTDGDMTRIAGTYHAWRGDKDANDYADAPGFCKTATLDDIRKHAHVLTPGRYVGAAEVEDDGEAFEDKMARLTAELETQFAQSEQLDAAIRANLRLLGFGS